MNIGKLLSLGALISFGFVDAFVLVGNPRRLQTSLHIGKRVDITDAIKTSSTTSNKKYGVANYKMLLWANGYASEIIEEIEYYVEDDKVVLKKGDFQNSTAVFIDEYEEMLNEFRPLLEKEELKTQKMKSLAREIKSAKEATENASSVLHESIAIARKATKKYGLNSVESLAAWEEFEKIAESEAEDLHLQPMTEIECLLDDIESFKEVWLEFCQECSSRGQIDL